MLTEDQVVDAVCRLLTEHGYAVPIRATAVQHGYDIVATKDGQSLIVEAKGAGSSKATTSRYGQEFSTGQVFDHVGKAVLKAMRVVSAGESRAAVALPDNSSHRSEIEQIAEALRSVGVGVFWVQEGGGASLVAPWSL